MCRWWEANEDEESPVGPPRARSLLAAMSLSACRRCQADGEGESLVSPLLARSMPAAGSLSTRHPWGGRRLRVAEGKREGRVAEEARGEGAEGRRRGGRVGRGGCSRGGGPR
ncbi:hypothetical protein DAI22_04g083450 [Oryza sativa Japonica Group]|nr:hypothetical protein DAI22_04g083450 [Oryza sativa Japonica Group]